MCMLSAKIDHVVVDDLGPQKMRGDVPIVTLLKGWEAAPTTPSDSAFFGLDSTIWVHEVPMFGCEKRPILWDSNCGMSFPTNI